MEHEGEGAGETVAAAVAVYPSDPRDGWEPGAPSARAMIPSVVGGAVIPLGVYYLVRHQVSGDAPALAIAGIPAAAWVGLQWWRRRRIDPIGLIVVVGFVAGLLVSAAMGGSAFVLKIRDSAFTTLFGLSCLVSLRWRRPVMFYVGRAMSTGNDRHRQAAYDELWELAPARHVFRVITVVWGVGLICEASARVVLAASLPTGTFLAVAPALAGVIFGSLFVFTLRYTKWARSQGEAAPAPVVE